MFGLPYNGTNLIPKTIQYLRMANEKSAERNKNVNPGVPRRRSGLTMSMTNNMR